MHLIFLLLYQNQHHCTYQEVDEKSYVHATLLDTITMLSFSFFQVWKSSSQTFHFGTRLMPISTSGLNGGIGFTRDLAILVANVIFYCL